MVWCNSIWYASWLGWRAIGGWNAAGNAHRASAISKKWKVRVDLQVYFNYSIHN